MSLARLCPQCQGCGRTSHGLFGEEHPQPTFTCGDTTAAGWSKCSKCDGVGVIAAIEGLKFANGMDVNEYLRFRLGEQ